MEITQGASYAISKQGGPGVSSYPTKNTRKTTQSTKQNPNAQTLSQKPKTLTPEYSMSHRAWGIWTAGQGNALVLFDPRLVSIYFVGREALPRKSNIP